MKSLYSTKFDSTVWAPLLLLDGPLCEASAPLVLIINQSYWCVDGGGPLYMYCWTHSVIHCEPLYIVIHGNSCGDMPSMNVKIVIQDFFGHWSALVLICLSLSLARNWKSKRNLLFVEHSSFTKPDISRKVYQILGKSAFAGILSIAEIKRAKSGNVKWSQVYFSIASDVHENRENTLRFLPITGTTGVDCPLFMNFER